MAAPLSGLRFDFDRDSFASNVRGELSEAAADDCDCCHAVANRCDADHRSTKWLRRDRRGLARTRQVNVASERCCRAARSPITHTYGLRWFADYPATDAIIWYFAFCATYRGVSFPSPISKSAHQKSAFIRCPARKTAAKKKAAAGDSRGSPGLRNPTDA